MKFSNAVKRLENKGYQVTFDYGLAVASKDGVRTIEIAQNGNEDSVSAIQVGASYPKSLKRAIELSETLGR